MITTPVTLNLHGAAPDAVLRPYILENSPEVEADRRRPLVLVLPGGGYAYRSFREAEPVAVRLLGLGFSACVLEYAVSPQVFPAALLQVFAAIHHIRQNAAAWHVDPDRITVMGFSAGGHLAACAGVFWNKPHYAGKLGLTPEQVQPNALCLGYPVITTREGANEVSMGNLLDINTYVFLQTMSLETQVGPHTPPAFVWHTFDDTVVPVENSLLLAQALRRARVPHAVHIYPDGPHGMSLANDQVYGPEHMEALRPEVARWPELFAQWLKTL